MALRSLSALERCFTFPLRGDCLVAIPWRLLPYAKASWEWITGGGTAFLDLGRFLSLPDLASHISLRDLTDSVQDETTRVSELFHRAFGRPVPPVARFGKVVIILSEDLPDANVPGSFEKVQFERKVDHYKEFQSDMTACTTALELSRAAFNCGATGCGLMLRGFPEAPSSPVSTVIRGHREWLEFAKKLLDLHVARFVQYPEAVALLPLIVQEVGNAAEAAFKPPPSVPQPARIDMPPLLEKRYTTDVKCARDDQVNARRSELTERVISLLPSVTDEESRYELDYQNSILIVDGYPPAVCICCYRVLDDTNTCKSHVISERYLKEIEVPSLFEDRPIRPPRIIDRTGSMWMYLQCVNKSKNKGSESYCDALQGRLLEAPFFKEPDFSCLSTLMADTSFTRDRVRFSSPIITGFFTVTMFRYLSANFSSAPLPFEVWKMINLLRRDTLQALGKPDLFSVTGELYLYVIPIDNVVYNDIYAQIPCVFDLTPVFCSADYAITILKPFIVMVTLTPRECYDSFRLPSVGVTGVTELVFPRGELREFIVSIAVSHLRLVIKAEEQVETKESQVQYLPSTST